MSETNPYKEQISGIIHKYLFSQRNKITLLKNELNQYLKDLNLNNKISSYEVKVYQQIEVYNPNFMVNTELSIEDKTYKYSFELESNK